MQRNIDDAARRTLADKRGEGLPNNRFLLSVVTSYAATYQVQIDRLGC